MQITLDVPDDIATRLAPASEDPARAALEAVGLEAYRQRRISGFQLRTLLGFESRWDLDGFLKEHRVETYTLDDWEKDWASIQELLDKRKLDQPA